MWDGEEGGGEWEEVIVGGGRERSWGVMLRCEDTHQDRASQTLNVGISLTRGWYHQARSKHRVPAYSGQGKVPGGSGRRKCSVDESRAHPGDSVATPWLDSDLAVVGNIDYTSQKLELDEKRNALTAIGMLVCATQTLGSQG
jgi:hypothetical protein